MAQEVLLPEFGLSLEPQLVFKTPLKTIQTWSTSGFSAVNVKHYMETSQLKVLWTWFASLRGVTQKVSARCIITDNWQL